MTCLQRARNTTELRGDSKVEKSVNKSNKLLKSATEGKRITAENCRPAILYRQPNNISYTEIGELSAGRSCKKSKKESFSGFGSAMKPVRGRQHHPGLGHNFPGIYFCRQHARMLRSRVPCYTKDLCFRKSCCEKLLEKGAAFLGSGYSGKPVVGVASNLLGERLSNYQLGGIDGTNWPQDLHQFPKDRLPVGIQV
jgi:hypothetical protein